MITHTGEMPFAWYICNYKAKNEVSTQINFNSFDGLSILLWHLFLKTYDRNKTQSVHIITLEEIIFLFIFKRRDIKTNNRKITFYEVVLSFEFCLPTCACNLLQFTGAGTKELFFLLTWGRLLFVIEKSNLLFCKHIRHVHL